MDFLLHGDFVDVLSRCWFYQRSAAAGRFFSALPLVIIWPLWCARNCFLFEELQPIAASVLFKIKSFFGAVTAAQLIRIFVDELQSINTQVLCVQVQRRFAQVVC